MPLTGFISPEFYGAMAELGNTYFYEYWVLSLRRHISEERGKYVATR